MNQAEKENQSSKSKIENCLLKPAILQNTIKLFKDIGINHGYRPFSTSQPLSTAH